MRPSIATLVGLLCLQSSLYAADLRFFDDAALHDIQFVDEKEGWAVGDDGVVLHTIDGGKNWERQATGVRASLRSVHFFKNNAFFGWIAGRQELPDGKGSVGVLLSTTDGGVRWTQLLESSLPGLNRVTFVDPKTGYIFGDGSDQFPSGLFKTSDGGKTWEDVKGTRAASWLAGAFSEPDTGLLVGSWSRLALLRPRGFGARDIKPLAGRAIADVHHSPTGTLAVAQGGVILSSTTLGETWGVVDVKLPTPVRACIDFRAIHGVGRSVWIVGRPGSFVLHAKDADNINNAHWELQHTNQPMPLNAVHFANENIGWAAGDLGTIVRTTDGGKTWSTLRQAGKRAAALFVHADAHAVPLDILALLGADSGNYVAALRTCAADASTAAPHQASADRRLSAAVRQAGGVAGETLWQFPLPQYLRDVSKKTVIRSWDDLHEGKAPEHFLRQLVLAVRMWQPHVVVTDDPSGTEAPAALTGEAMVQAASIASDPGAFPEQIETLGLKPWRPAQVFCAVNQRDQAHVIINCQDSRIPLEASIRDFAATAAALVSDRPEALPEERFYRSLTLTGKAPSSLLEGILVGEDGRRKSQLQKDTSEEVVQAIRTRRSLDMMAHRALRGDQNEAAKALAQIGPMLEKLPDEHGAAAAFAVGTQYVRAGQWALAREIFLLMVDRYPAHSLSVEAYRWLIQHNSSSEARRRHEQEHFTIAGTTFSDAEKQGLIKASAIKDGKQEVVPANAGKASLLHNQMESRQWHHGGLKIGQRLMALGPVHGFDPSIQFCLQSSRRQLGEVDKTQDWYGKFRTFYPGGVWHEAATAENWLLNRNGPAAKTLAECRLADAPPFLDGKFDDPCWQDRKPMRFGNAIEQPQTGEGAVDALASEFPTQAWFAFDKQYFYIALRCEHPAGQFVPKESVRKRDAELRPYDRVSILLDLDRDYTTYFHLQVDQRGCAREDCWGDLSWDPRWFVAIASDEKGWNVEAAIPMSEFTLTGVPLGSAWACNVVRTVPGRGVVSWSRPADVEPRPEGMGLLLFQRSAERKQGQ